MVYCLLKYNELIESLKHIIKAGLGLGINRVWPEWRYVKPLWQNIQG